MFKIFTIFIWFRSLDAWKKIKYFYPLKKRNKWEKLLNITWNVFKTTLVSVKLQSFSLSDICFNKKRVQEQTSIKCTLTWYNVHYYKCFLKSIPNLFFVADDCVNIKNSECTPRRKFNLNYPSQLSLSKLLCSQPSPIKLHLETWFIKRGKYLYKEVHPLMISSWSMKAAPLTPFSKFPRLTFCSSRVDLKAFSRLP